jgi:hypothetical protein
MRLIKYLYQLGEGDEQSLVEKVLGCETEAIFLASLEIVKLESYNGEYTVVDDGQPDVEEQATDAERIAELEEALALLLSGVTE